jgi:hypothetical protein
MKTSELTGTALDLWVARACGYEMVAEPEQVGLAAAGMREPVVFTSTSGALGIAGEALAGKWMPSTDWAQGGPLIDKFDIDVNGELDGTFWASIDGPASVPESDVGCHGSTRLIAAMRCIVRSAYYDNVPDEAE